MRRENRQKFSVSGRGRTFHHTAGEAGWMTEKSTLTCRVRKKKSCQSADDEITTGGDGMRIMSNVPAGGPRQKKKKKKIASAL